MAPRNQGKNSQGFTLVEIAIVLVIIGLLLGGILKGQELVNGAKVRSMTDRQNSLKSAWFLFYDRFQNLPGDFEDAGTYILGASSGNGNGIVEEEESPLAFQHLTSAGYIRCPQCTETATDSYPNPANSPINVYGGVMAITHNSTYAARSSDPATAVTAAATNHRLSVFSGLNIPSNILAEVDRKVDDGIANTGDFVFNQYKPTQPPTLIGANFAECMRQDSTGATPAATLYDKVFLFWRPAATPGGPVDNNCSSSVYI